MSARAAIEHLFRPRSIAIVGASNTPGKRGYVLMTNLARMQYEGRVYPIHPSHESVLGHRCYPRLDALPERPDAAAVCLGAEAVTEVIEDCGRLGIKALAVVAAGFADAGESGLAIQQQMLEAAARCGVSIMGPNGIGILNRIDRVQYWMTAPDSPLYRDRTPTGVSAVLQSGALGLTVTNDCLERGLALDYVVSAGSGVSIDVADYIEWMLDDARSSPKVIGCVIEGINKPELFRRVARRALRQGTALVVLRSGRSPTTRELIASHTGAMVGSAAVADAVFHADGVISVTDMDQWLEQLILHAHRVQPAGKRWFMLSPSGGGNAVMSDIAADIGLPIPPAPASLTRAMNAIAERPVQNPFDAAGYYDAIGIDEQAIAIATDDPEVDVVIGWLSMFPVAGRGHTRLLKALANHAACGKKPVLMCSFTAGPISEFSREILRSGGMYPMKGARNSLLAFKRWLDWHDRRRQLSNAVTEDHLPEHDPRAPDSGALPSGVANETIRSLTFEASRPLLAAAGLDVVPGGLVTDLDAAEEFTARHGFPVVMKIEHPQLLHKSEVGGVEIGLSKPSAVRAAFERLLESVERAGLEGAEIAIQKQLDGGAEVLISVQRDAVFGAYVVVGLGGTQTELFKDLALRPAPVDWADAQGMLRELKAWPLLDGFRGRPRADQSAAANAIVSLSRLAEQLGPALNAIEINPLIVMPEGQGAWVVDAVVQLN